MQYLKRFDWPQINGNLSLQELITTLFFAVGRYCSFCEKSLIIKAYLFHRERGVIKQDATFAQADWPDVFLICEDCVDNSTEMNEHLEYLWPDSPSLAQNVPSFLYSKKENVIFEIVRKDGSRVESSVRSFVFVDADPNADSAVALAARNTIALFQLNSKYYHDDEQAPHITIPYDDFINGYDQRMELRYDAYLRASQAIDSLKFVLPTLQANRAIMDPMLAQITSLARSTGFVSTWLAAFHDLLDTASTAQIFPLANQGLTQADLYDFKIEEDVEVAPMEGESEPLSGRENPPDQQGMSIDKEPESQPPPNQQGALDQGDQPPPSKRQKLT